MKREGRSGWRRDDDRKKRMRKRGIEMDKRERMKEKE
jgi:hypothetical protein